MNFLDNKAQISVELILIFASVIIVVVIAINIYKTYLLDMDTEIRENELSSLISSLDEINNHIKN
ncbi:class III signal peptide-containing protein [Methanosphaera cuniculi]|uniref:class III signal peptide-containing protein n=1 Tax=Methanosphaera cuniculi TaxID=1077256 RepID=UPI0026F22597|nr:class III signal peptide-containing protein [Methanosphaera cuniculi]